MVKRREVLVGAVAVAGAAMLPHVASAQAARFNGRNGMTEAEHGAAIRAISMLKARYFRFVDTQDWEGLRGLFTPDATLFFPEGQDAPTNLADSIARIAAILDGAVSIHHGHMPEIELLSADSAKGVWAMEDRLYWSSSRAADLGIESVHGFGHYHEDYARLDGRWLIRRLKLTRLRVIKYPTPRVVT